MISEQPEWWYLRKASVVDIYLSKNPDVPEILERITEMVIRKYKFRTMDDNEEIYFYEESSGCWKRKGKSLIKKESDIILAKLSTHQKNEIIEKIRIRTYSDRKEFNSKMIVGVKNGVIDLETYELLPHSHENLITRSIPIIFNPESECPNFIKFINEVIQKENVHTIMEAIGYCLYPRYHIHRSLFLLGSGRNGKSTLQNTVRAFLGKGNYTNKTIQQLGMRFGAAQLFGKMANLANEIPNKALTSTDTFKALCGGDMIWSDIKNNQDGIEFFNKAKLWFSGNEIPPTEYDESEAFYERWIIIDFPNVFRDNADEDLETKITTEEELSGLLNFALKGLQRLLARGRFEKTIDIGKKKRTYIMGSNPIKAFIMDRCISNPNHVIEQSLLYEAYKEFCIEYGKSVKDLARFTTGLKKHGKGIDITRKRIEGERVKHYRGISLVN